MLWLLNESSVADRLNAISPLDGRYSSSVKDLSAYFSESALMRYRVTVEVEYLIALGREKGIKELQSFTNIEQTKLRNIYRNFNVAAAQKIKKIELSTNHDVKAVEYFLQSKMKKTLHHFLIMSLIKNLNITI